MSSKEKKRVDELMLERGLVDTRSKAQSFIMQGAVEYLKAGESTWRLVEKAGLALRPSDVELRFRAGTQNQDVGRGAQKLRGALDQWTAINVQAALALDLGSSTGGFTQVLLERGATSVVAMDVGTHQLHEKLRADPRVVVMEQTHVLKVDEDFWQDKKATPPFDVIVTDLSFISLTKIIPHVTPWLKKSGHWILLIKPQFEVGPKKAPGGIVKDPRYHK
jgi:23S rRNA (cytidine1920-2'-O)/16S rRNA (cytidine1409-2'-O)-methyltransferase